MRFFDFLSGPEINREVAAFRGLSGGVLLDVRTPQEYRDGHIPGSINAPLQTLSREAALPAYHDAPIFVYCHSGVRSGQAADPDGLFQRKKHRRHGRLHGKGGTLT